MATATSSTFPPYDRSVPIQSENPPLTTQTRRVVPIHPNATPPRPGQHLDDADLLAWKRQYANISLREQNMMSNSAEDLTQLIDRVPFQFEAFGHDYNDMDDDEIHFDNGAGYDYETAIQDRLKKANEEFKHDDTPAELKHRQRVSFDAVVKAVDIVQDPQEYTDANSIPKQEVSPVPEEPPASLPEVPDETNPHQYTVPLNDTQPKEGPSLLQQLKALQFHGVQPTGERWSSTRSNGTHDTTSPRENSTPSTTQPNPSNDLHKSMVVSINGGFELQSEEDYTAKRSANSLSPKSSDEENEKSSSTVKKLSFLPTPPSDGRGDDNSPKSQAPHRSFPPMVRPKSSDTLGRSENGARTTTTTRSLSDPKAKPGANGQARAKSAGVSKSLTPFFMKPSAGVDFDKLNQQAAKKKREQLQEENRKKEEAEKNRKEELEKAKESFEKWMHDKDTERKRLNEEKRMEREEHESRQLACNKELAELREAKYQKWLERKNREVTMANEFKKLQANDEEVISGESSSSNNQNHRAFHRWLRRKYEQSREEKRLLRLEQRRLRRRQRRSIKRFQLLQDLQLAKSFGYS